MEWVWYTVAALGAGIGTGLAGLSAATVMVPILIVLCPSFSGETGVYQATAIALASDILGSAVTARTYAKNGRIDLKRGWGMLLCVLSMCAAGSYVAFLVENVVLGSFTLILTFCIGLRFLISPDTKKTRPAGNAGKLDGKGIAVSVFFGLTIGFGTGFVGTGGGMMMLVVFTAFLGMELKTAVGTSTFIMTFTALIASISHILIHPAIILQKWDVLVLCVAVATTASLVTARFANRVKNRTAGLLTGAVLTVLGAAMLMLNFREELMQIRLVRDMFHCMGVLAGYIIPCVMVLLPIRFLTRVPSFVFRKMLHAVAFTCISLTILASRSWQAVALTSVLTAVVIYPLLKVFEKKAWYPSLFVEKRPGEIRKSLLMLFFTFAVVIVVSWGIFDQPHLAAAAVMMWGTGDAAAALVGVPFGKHKVRSRFTDGKKSWEGSGAMLAVSFLAGAGILYFVQKAGLPTVLLGAGIGALLGTVTELVSPSEYDTVTVPAVIVAVLLILC